MSANKKHSLKPYNRNVFLSFGGDPELFVFDKKTDKPIDPAGFSKGTKRAPETLFMSSGRGGLQVDGFALEMNIPPAYTFEKFDNGIRNILETMEARIKDGNKLVARASVFFDPDVIEKAAPEQRALGCDPDFDAYTLQPNPTPTVPSDPRGVLRSGGGHVAIGWTNGVDIFSDQHLADCVRLVRNLDCVLYSAEHLWDNDTERRKLYGKPGAFRAKPFGVEYRTLSNAWVMNKKLRKFVFDASLYAACVSMYNGDLTPVLGGKKFDTTKEYNDFMKKMPSARYPTTYVDDKQIKSYMDRGLKIDIPAPQLEI